MRRTTLLPAVASALLSTILLGSAVRAEPAPVFRSAGSIVAPDGRWDFTSWDAAHKRLLI